MRLNEKTEGPVRIDLARRVAVAAGCDVNAMSRVNS
jgi:hypothetical protein